MPRIKTHRATARRIGIAGSGNPKGREKGSGHLRQKTANRAKHEICKEVNVAPADVERIERLLATWLRSKRRKSTD
jgi:ribosomal protein L35